MKFSAEPQLMLTAGPGMMAPGYAPAGVYGAPAQGVYAPAAAAYQGYGMWEPLYNSFSNTDQHLLFYKA